MGGYGSGGHNKQKDYTDIIRRVSISDMQKLGTLKGERCIFSTNWSLNGRPNGSMEFIYNHGDDFITAVYTITYTETGATEDRADRINLDYVKTNYGRRAYFVCSCCSSRAVILYYVGRMFKCRKCSNLNYWSSQRNRDYMEKYGDKISKVLVKLKHQDKRDYDAHHVERPKGMRQYTYKRLISKLQEFQYKRDYYFYKKLASLRIN